MKKGTFSSLATFAIISWAAIHFDCFDQALPLLRTFFSGGAIAIQEDGRKTIGDLLPICAAIIPLDFMVTTVTTIGVGLLLGSAPEAADKTLRLSTFGSIGYMPRTPGFVVKGVSWLNHQLHLVKVWLSAKINQIKFGNLEEILAKAAPGHSSAFMGLRCVSG